MVNIAFTGGGTGGHIYPGLAVAERLAERLPGGFRIFWIGSGRGMDREIVEAAGIEFLGIPAGKLRRYLTPKTVPDAFRVAAGFAAARSVLKKLGARILFSKGGFVSVPPCAAAASLGIPVFTHESDFSPGLATKLNIRFARRSGGRIFTAYPDTAAFMPSVPAEMVTVSGNPVRRAFRSADPEKGRAFLGLASDDKILLVLGGSQGAGEVNRLVRDGLENLCRHYVVVHQHGPSHGGSVPPRSPRYIPLPYIGDEMPHVMAAAELVLGRSGAGTVWESATLGKPMVLVPLAGPGTRGDQIENARFFESQGAAKVLSGNGATAENLSRAVGDLASDSAGRNEMAEASARIGGLDGAAIIGDSIVEMLCRWDGA